jgi:hypothetical protein
LGLNYTKFVSITKSTFSGSLGITVKKGNGKQGYQLLENPDHLDTAWMLNIITIIKDQPGDE